MGTGILLAPRSPIRRVDRRRQPRRGRGRARALGAASQLWIRASTRQVTTIFSPGHRSSTRGRRPVRPWRAASRPPRRSTSRRARAPLRPVSSASAAGLPAHDRAKFDAIAATFPDAFPRVAWRGTSSRVCRRSVSSDTTATSRASRWTPARVSAPDAASPYSWTRGPWLYPIGTLDPAAPRWRAARRHTLDRLWPSCQPGDARAVGPLARLTGARSTS